MAKMTPEQLVEQLRRAYGPELRSVVLYGSAAAGEHIPKRSDYNVLVVVDALSLDRLSAAASVARAWSEGGNPAPMTLTMSEWRGAAATLPAEDDHIHARRQHLSGG